MQIVSHERSPAHASLIRDSQQSAYLLGAVSSRRRLEACLLATISLLALVRLRATVQPWAWLAMELLISASIFALLRRWLIQKLEQSISSWAKLLSACAVVLSPILMNVIFKIVGQGASQELSLMTALAWGAMLMAACSQVRRHVSLSVVASGFLTLFITCSSDQTSAIVFALLWAVVCLWWLVANHWERVDTCMATTVDRASLTQPMTVGVGTCLFVVAAWLASGWLTTSHPLGWELLPTSGGTSQHDSTARSGVGDGAAIVAAKENASAFGAVETNQFLDSPEPSLFDLYSETFGEPIRPKRNEMAVALSLDPMNQDQHHRPGESRQSSATFSTHRRSRIHQHTRDRDSEAIMYWIGRRGISLAVERFDEFDGVNWSHSEPRRVESSVLESIIGEKHWYSSAPERMGISGPYVGAIGEALKFMRYGSARLPTPAGNKLWHIDMVNRADFFAVTPDECLIMPGREKVPDYTILRLVNSEIDLGKLEVLTAHAPRYIANGEGNLPEPALLGKLSEKWGGDYERGWPQVNSIIQQLRKEFVFDRSTATSTDEANPLENFVRLKRGNDVQFATAAAIMLRHVGYHTRFVTGFYVAPHRSQPWTGEAAITAEDTHAWLEIQVADKQWVPLEPTPGFAEPVYHISWAYWLSHQWQRILTALVSAGVMSAVIWRLRASLFEIGCCAAWLIVGLLNHRTRIRLLLYILELRGWLAGRPRPRSIVPRHWLAAQTELTENTLRRALQRLCDEADRVWFGGATSLSPDGLVALKTLWWNLTVRCLSRSRSGRSLAHDLLAVPAPEEIK